MIHKQFYYKQHPHLHNLSLTSNDITINILHPHNPQYTTPTNKQIFKYMLYLHFALILVTTLNLCSALKFRTYICVYTKSLPWSQVSMCEVHTLQNISALSKYE